jgi:prepilin-type N-terminal cleavage/methylation domain-containing protein
MRQRRRGFTLIELLIAIVLLLIVSTAIYQLLIRTQRISREQSERIDLQSNLRVGSLILPAELREVGYDYEKFDSTDILGIATDSIAFRAIRSSGIICGIAANAIVVDTSRNYSAYRLPVPGRDTLMLFAERDVTKSDDDKWVRRRITIVGSGVCSASFGSRPGLQLTTQLTVGGSADSFVVGSPMRTFEPVVYKLYASGGKNYLGTYSKTMAGEAIQPILGPLQANGLRLEYFDSLGAGTAVRGQIRSVRITLLGITDQKVNAGGGLGTPSEALDSLRTMVSLRNMLR